MQNRDNERRRAWERIRSHYKKNLAMAPPEDEERVKAEYKAAKTRQYRKQFKQDYPEFEAEIDLHEEYKEMARNDIRQIIRPFYPTPIRSGFTPGMSPKQVQHLFGTAFVIFGTATILASYDVCKICVYRTQPSVIINLLGIGIMFYALQGEIPKEPKDNWKPNLSEYMEAWWHNRSDIRPLPNYKTILDNEKNTERSH